MVHSISARSPRLIYLGEGLRDGRVYLGKVYECTISVRSPRWTYLGEALRDWDPKPETQWATSPSMCTWYGLKVAISKRLPRIHG